MKFHKLILILTTMILACCGGKKGGFRVAATPVPHAQMLEFIKPDLEEKGIDLVIVVTEDYNMPNRALAEKDLSANFFQHIPFLEEQVKEFHYPIESIAKIEIEPMGVYSKKYQSLSNLPMHAMIAIPNDPTNEARALFLLQKAGLIQLNTTSLNATIQNISYNPKSLQFHEIDAAMLPRSLRDVDAAVINTNYALEAKLNPQKDALLLEGPDSAYVNVLVVHDSTENDPKIVALKEAMTSNKMREFIEKKYKGAVIPAF